MLTQMNERKTAVNYMFAEMPQTSALRDRCPSAKDWAIAKAMTDVLDFPCKIVMKGQNAGKPLLLLYYWIFCYVCTL